MISADELRRAIGAQDEDALLTIEVSAGCKTESFPSGFNPWRNAVGIQVKAPAVEGKANKAIISLISSTLELPKTAIFITSGQTSSVKRILLIGMNEAALREKLLSLLNK